MRKLTPDQRLAFSQVAGFVVIPLVAMLVFMVWVLV